MAVSRSGSVQETAPADSDPQTGPDDAIDPQSIEPSVGEDLSGVEVASGGRPVSQEAGPPDVEAAIAASLQTNGAAATRDQIMDGTLTAADGRLVLDGTSTDDRLDIASDLVDGIRERAGETVEISSQTSAMYQYEKNTIVDGVLEPGFEDPQGALRTLRSLSDEERDVLRTGDTSVLGEQIPGAEVDANALAEYSEMWDQNRKEARQIYAYESREQAIEHLEELGEGPAPGRSEPRRPGQTESERMEQDLGKKNSQADIDPMDRMGYNIQQSAFAPQSI